MSYKIVLSPKAEKTFLGLEPPQQNAIETHFLRLAGSPVSLSRPAVMPYPAGSQLYEFGHDLDDQGHHFAVMFRYGQDEETLHIIAIGHTRFQKP